MSHVSRGNAAENFVARHLEAEGYTVGSRRHCKGGGDHLAVHPSKPGLLIETKGCKPGQLWMNFRRAQREEMRDTPLPSGFERTVAHVIGSGAKRKIEWHPEEVWPNAR